MTNTNLGTRKKSLNEDTIKEATKDPEIYTSDSLKHGVEEKVKQAIIYLKNQVTFKNIFKYIFAHSIIVYFLQFARYLT